MSKPSRARIAAFVFAIAVLLQSQRSRAADPLPSWNEGATKASIVEFVRQVTTEGSPEFIPAAERIATFDNDGTLWAEQPFYFQLYFAVDRVKALAPQHPEWVNQEPFASVLNGNLKALAAGGEKALFEIILETHAGMTTEEFEKLVLDWIATAKHSETGKLFTDMVYRPMLELLDYLRDNGFKSYIVSGGGIEFMRPWAERVYGLPPAQVIGSSIMTKYELRDGTPILMRLPELNFFDDKAGKPVAIHQHIGRRPIAAFGNSDGDYQMLEWTTSGKGLRLGLIVHHTDAEREFAYDRASQIGKLAKGLDDAPAKGWVVLDMKTDWKQIWNAPPAPVRASDGQR